MISTYRVLYWGAPGVGRSTSVQDLLGTNEGELVTGDRDYLLRWPATKQGLVLRYSSLATKHFYRAGDPVRPPQLQPLIEFLGTIDGVVFVVDSQPERREHNLGWLDRLRADLRLAGRELNTMSVVFQLNKRDIPDVMSVADIQADLKTERCSYLESVASSGIGTKEALRELLRLIDERGSK